MPDDPTFSESHLTPIRSEGRRSAVTWLLDFFSSFRLCIVLLTLLFFYCSIGSAGMFVPEGWNVLSPSNWSYAQLRQWPVFEMTEFEWFHTPFFYALNALLVVNMSVATIRRIPFKPVSYGSWMIHSGIVVLIVGCVIYFSTKIEGDAPVWRRSVVVTVPGGHSTTLPAIPGRRVNMQGDDGAYAFQIADINPNWPILSGDDEGEVAYSVNVRITTPRGDTFVRQLLAGYPQYTEDVLPGEGRVKKLERFGGSALVDNTVALSLIYDAQDHFWVKDSSAIYIREANQRGWSERVIKNMPRYNEYLPSADEAFPDALSPDMIRSFSAAGRPDDDLLGDIDVRVTGFVPYAELQTRATPSDDAPVYPTTNIEFFTGTGEPTRYQLAAFDPRGSEVPGGAVRFVWVDNPRMVDALDEGHAAILTIGVPEAGINLEVPFTAAELGDRDPEFTPIEGTEYAYRVTSILPRFPIGQRMLSLAIVEFKTPDETFARWVGSDPSITRDLADGAHMPSTDSERALDERFVTTFDAVNLATVTVVAGPQGVVTPRVLVLNPSGSGTFTSTQVPVGGEPKVILPGQGVSVRIADLYERSEQKTLPRIVPRSLRDLDTARGRFAALAQVELSAGGKTYTQWVHYHRYAFDRDLYYGGSMGNLTPTTFVLDDGRVIQAIFSRETERIANPVALDDFVLEERVGGYTQQAGAQSVRNWTSELRFLKSDATWTEPRAVSANNPKAFGGLWFFQASWDPPRGPSQTEPNGYAGLNHTGLGVGNRKGVWTMLLGSCISVLGMIYAFYIKPVIKRRQRDAVYAGLKRTMKSERQAVSEAKPMRRSAVALWFLVGVLIASGAAYLALKSALKSALADPSTFAGQVDLTPLDRSAVYSRGRLKSFDSFANEILGFVTGNKRIQDQPTDFTFLDLLFVPERYADTPLIFVKKQQIRAKLIGAASPLVATMTPTQGEQLQSQLDAFMETGLVSPTFFELDPVRAQLMVMQRDVVKTAKFVNQIQSAMSLRQPEVLGDILRIIPPPSGRESEMWLSPMDLFGGQPGMVSPTAIAAEELPALRREALRQAFQRLGDLWFQTRTIELREGPQNLDLIAFEEAIVQWLGTLPPRAEELRTQGMRHLVGISQMDTAERFARLDRFGKLITDEGEELSWSQHQSRYFALVHVAELAAPDEMMPERITLGARLTSDAIAGFAALLPSEIDEEAKAEGALYPNQSRLQMESWYFKVGGATWIWIVYLLSMLMLLMAVVYKWSGARAMGMGLFSSAFLMHTVVLGWRWYVSGRWPNSNMFEAVTTSVWLGTLCVIGIELFARKTPMRNLFALTAAGASMVAMMSATYLPQLDSNIGNMMPILHDMWLYIHTNVIIASYALIGMSAITGFLYLAWRAMGKGPDHATVGGTDMLLRTAPGASGLKRSVSAGAVFDGATMILIELSFVMLWAGLVMGAIWADHSWGRPWGWDPKEVFALNTFFVYLVLIHIRLSSKDKGLWTALLALVGCGVMLFNWIVINFVISGLHSYA